MPRLQTDREIIETLFKQIDLLYERIEELEKELNKAYRLAAVAGG